jgi:hypothetical protein
VIDQPSQPPATYGKILLVKGGDQGEGRPIYPTSPGSPRNQRRLASGLELFSPRARGAGGIAPIPSHGYRCSISLSTPALGINPHLQGLGVPAVFLDGALVFRDALLDGQLLIALISRLVTQKTLLGIGVGAH